MERRQKSKQVKISYDYNGTILRQYDKARNNLVEKMLDLKLKNQQTMKKNEPPELSDVGSVTKKGYKKKDRGNHQEDGEFL